MSETGAPPFAPVDIGSRAEPPFAKLPDPATHFRLRAQRFAVLAQSGGELAPYLHFMAGLAEAQHRTHAAGLPEPVAATEAERARARQHAMPPIDRDRFVEDPALAATFDRLFALAPQITMPDQARAALGHVTRMAAEERQMLARAAFDDRIDPARIAEQAFAAAAMQVHAARLAFRLDAGALVPVGQGACPACGGSPVASLVVGWQGAHGTRFVSCALCSTLWHEVRVKCVCCGSTGGIGYQEVENGPGAGLVRAETCATCNRYLKIMLQHKEPALDPVADDVATLALDMLLRDGALRRGGVDPFLLGY
ncbi:MAG TPA: formate dehydrogenase accessory protein FdhE [Rhodoblastus sp.]|nr:formate dehydrogenase accessory protein FdhE [Rhodoblastus sp.]